MLTLRKGGHRDLDRYYSAFEIDFDRKELLPKLGLHLAMTKGDAELLIVYDEESRIEAGYALTLCRGLYGYVLLKYFGVLPWYRDKGIGAQAMRLVNRYYAERQGILAELAVFDPEDKDTGRKLEKFFSRFGYEPVPVNLRLSGTEAKLLVKPIQGSAEIAPVAHRILRDLYSRVLGPTAMERMLEIRKPE